MKTVFVCGNPAVPEDFIAIKISRALKEKLPFVQFRETNSLTDLEFIPREFVVLDCAKGIDEIVVLNDLKAIESGKKISLHDFDFATELLLLHKLGKLEGKNFCIIAVPFQMRFETALKDVATLLSKNE
ncbi:MAG: hypothetical protein JW772_05775 [Candidatus Diapherotrites archaeon]|nr:hypothetical protein [Candidatus Diapherotrites archaeon]